MKRMLWLVFAGALMAGSSGCSNHDSSSQPLSERQRDSILARSDLPGARMVGHALNASDDQAARAAAMRASMDSLFH